MAPRRARDDDPSKGGPAASSRSEWSGFRPNDHLVEPFAAPFLEAHTDHEAEETEIDGPQPHRHRWWRRLFRRRRADPGSEPER